MGKSYTMTKGELIESVKPAIVGFLSLSLGDLLRGDKDAIRLFNSWTGDLSENATQNIGSELSGAMKRIIETWCDSVSGRWFDEHPGIDDVLLVTSPPDSNVTFKEWLASR
jgi:hypothetical protein